MAEAARHGRMPVDEARVRVLDAMTPTAWHEKVPLHQALGRVLVEDVAVPGDVPPFDYSAMDG